MMTSTSQTAETINDQREPARRQAPAMAAITPM